ncbi:uncharacterized protein LOC131931514 isoform X2 [Physella acuta]|uniref:uncharacterized protein LOC131931514 isoform X2 n=1 Tax=Physella acuta TaxID=109671 RepID=UPI0027DBB872|nr:uncharacterized protein LOC131931514 isoform X2 [Physella acuta]
MSNTEDNDGLTTKHLFESFRESTANLIERIEKESQKQSGQMNYLSLRHLVCCFLNSAFKIGQAKENLKKISHLETSLKLCSDAIDNTIYYHGNAFDVDYVPKYLVLRSGLQFLIDADSSFKAECESEDSYLHESIQLFDEGLKKWQQSNDYSGFYNITHSPEDLSLPDGVPQHHNWWLSGNHPTEEITKKCIRAISLEVTKMGEASDNLSSNDLDLILIGKTGHGKSSTGNSILRRADIFKPSYSMTSGTKEPHFEWSKFEGRTLQVVDSPGVLGTCEDEEGGITLVHEALQNTMMANPKGYHAFLVVLRFGARFTQRDRKTVEIFKGILGENFLKDYGIIVMTNGETFEQFFRIDAKPNLETFCAIQKGSFKCFLEECNNRIVVFSNLTQDENVKNRQVQQLIDMVDKLGNDGRRYTNEHFKRADEFYQQLLVSTSIPLLNKQVLQEQSLIMHEITAIEKVPEDKDKILNLQNILPRLERLLESLKEKDRGTCKLAALITNVNDAKMLVNDRLKFYTNIGTKKAKTELQSSLNLRESEIENERKRINQILNRKFFKWLLEAEKKFGYFILCATDITTVVSNFI